MIKLRPHHLLCILGWRGQGYDERFSANFDRIIAELKSATQVELVAGPDDICASCPKNASGECAPDGIGAAAGIDDRATKRIPVTTGRTYAFRQLLESVAKLTPADLESICRGCPWLPNGRCQAALGRFVGHSVADGVFSGASSRI